MSDPKHDLAGQQVQPVMLTHVGDGATALTNRDIAADLANLDIALSALRDAIRGASAKDLTTLQAVLEAWKTGALNADDLTAETGSVLKVIAHLAALDASGTFDRLLTRDLDSVLQEDVKGLVVAAQLWAKNGGAANYHLPMTGAQYLNDAETVSAADHALKVLSYLSAWNGAKADRWRNNSEFTILASAVRAATTSSADLVNYNARGVMLWFDLTAVPGVDTVQVTVELKDPVSGKYTGAYYFEAALAGTGFRTYLVYPGHTAGQLNGSINQAIPRTWRVTVTHVGAGNFTYSVGGCYIL